MAWRRTGAKPLTEPMLAIWSIGTHFCAITIKIHFSFNIMCLKMSSAKCRPPFLGLNELIALSLSRPSIIISGIINPISLSTCPEHGARSPSAPPHSICWPLRWPYVGLPRHVKTLEGFSGMPSDAKWPLCFCNLYYALFCIFYLKIFLVGRFVCSNAFSGIILILTPKQQCNFFFKIYFCSFNFVHYQRNIFVWNWPMQWLFQRCQPLLILLNHYSFWCHKSPNLLNISNGNQEN